MRYVAQYKRKQPPSYGEGNAYKQTIVAASESLAWEKATIQCKANYRVIAIYKKEVLKK